MERAAGRSPLTSGWALRAFGAVFVRPGLWATAVVQLFVLARPGWWRRWPPLPAPDPDYLRFRLVTFYGGAGDRPPGPAELVEYLNWCRRMRKISR